jgi:hypothetical protein
MKLFEITKPRKAVSYFLGKHAGIKSSFWFTDRSGVCYWLAWRPYVAATDGMVHDSLKPDDSRLIS